MWRYVLVYLVAVNGITFAAFAVDKHRAMAGERRTPERLLLNWAVAGGWAGAVAAQQLLRHKTRKEPFRSNLWSICAIEATAAFLLSIPPVRSGIVIIIGALMSSLAGFVSPPN